MSAALPANRCWLLSGVQPRREWPALKLSIPQGHTVVLGLSGAGKTTLLNLLAGFLKPQSGNIELPSRIAWVPQDHGLWLAHTAREHLSLVGASAKAIASLLEAFDLSALANQRADFLSQGEAARLSVARALAQDADAVVMDEPLAHVDPARAGKYWREIRSRLAGRTAVIATHQPDVALGLGEHAICLRDGVVEYQGPVNVLYHSPASETLAALLGPANWLTPSETALWLGEPRTEAACIRPERLAIQPAESGSAVVNSRFLGACAETELRHPSGVVKTFFHRPISALPKESIVRLQEIPRA